MARLASADQLREARLGAAVQIRPNVDDQFIGRNVRLSPRQLEGSLFALAQTGVTDAIVPGTAGTLTRDAGAFVGTAWASQVTPRTFPVHQDVVLSKSGTGFLVTVREQLSRGKTDANGYATTTGYVSQSKPMSLQQLRHGSSTGIDTNLSTNHGFGRVLELYSNNSAVNLFPRPSSYIDWQTP